MCHVQKRLLLILMKMLKSIKELVFNNNNIPKNNQVGQLHVVDLQMIGNGTVKLVVEDQTKIGTSKLVSPNIATNVCGTDIKRNGRIYSTSCCVVHDYWNGINVANFNW